MLCVRYSILVPVMGLREIKTERNRENNVLSGKTVLLFSPPRARDKNN